MCGILAAAAPMDLWAALGSLAHRGPDGQAWAVHAGVSLGHTRLAIRDLSPEGGGLFRAGPVLAAYNGELFNTAHIRGLVDAATGGYRWSTTGDTEVVTAALATLPAGEVLGELDGMFAIAWADDRDPGVLNVARDAMGEVPLHLSITEPLMAASEMKALVAAGRRRLVDVPAGSWWRLGGCPPQVHRWFAGLPPPSPVPAAPPLALAGALRRAVGRRLVSDVPVCTLLSGGIDSAVITAELALRVPGLVAYTAVMDPKSPDVRAARLVAGHLGIKLVEVEVKPPTAVDLAFAAWQVEQDSKAQVEIAWPCLALAAAVAADGFKVTYSGEGSDELWASYGMAYHQIRAHGWDGCRRRLIAAQARRNFPRVNKAFMAAGVEARLPFCDREVVGLALGLPQRVVADGSRPKAVLENAYVGRLPASVLRRAKLAFQDGLGMKAAAAQAVADPGRFYRAEYARNYGR